MNSQLNIHGAEQAKVIHDVFTSFNTVKLLLIDKESNQIELVVYGGPETFDLIRDAFISPEVVEGK